MKYKAVVELVHILAKEELRIEQIIRRAFIDAGLNNCVVQIAVAQRKGK